MSNSTRSRQYLGGDHDLFERATCERVANFDSRLIELEFLKQQKLNTERDEHTGEGQRG
jgi:hypothetical protein